MSGGPDLERRSDVWWNDVWRDGDLDAVLGLFTDPFVRHTSTGTESLSPAQYRDRLASVQRVLSRAVTVVDDRVVDHDRVWTRATTRGVNLDTGEASILTWLLIQRFEADRIAEQWTLTVPGVDWEPNRR